MTYQQLYQILVEAENRRDNPNLPTDVRERSGETVSLVEERMRREGLTRFQLLRGY